MVDRARPVLHATTGHGTGGTSACKAEPKFPQAAPKFLHETLRQANQSAQEDVTESLKTQPASSQNVRCYRTEQSPTLLCRRESLQRSRDAH
jgi:hypothetical protein